ncbi:hypothetical protein [Nesterenkonia salmonea]|uniref:hypothetical protein n=1 Tax=Nesterenkonia salmonea TaxID=1804987 RepID=UPI001407FFEE|nr:hypothetical protein [Nesterenkonia salmonea]
MPTPDDHTLILSLFETGSPVHLSTPPPHLAARFQAGTSLASMLGTSPRELFNERPRA